jgi:hypothetical protein
MVKEAHDARVPNQLVGDSGDDGQQADVDEVSVAGGVAGFTASVGADPDTLGRRKNAPKRKARK